MLRRHARHDRSRTRDLLFPRKGWRRRLTYLGKRMTRLSATPHAIARGFATGTFFAFSPLLGLHAILAVAVAAVLRGSLPAAVLGTAICNPLTLPFILGADYEVGHFLTTGSRAADAATVPLADGLAAVMPVLVPLLVGSVVIGAAAAGVGYLGMLGAVTRMRTRRRLRLAEVRR